MSTQGVMRMLKIFQQLIIGFSVLFLATFSLGIAQVCSGIDIAEDNVVIKLTASLFDKLNSEEQAYLIEKSGIDPNTINDIDKACTLLDVWVAGGVLDTKLTGVAIADTLPRELARADNQIDREWLVCFVGSIAGSVAAECDPAVVREELASNEGLRLTFSDKGELDEALSTVETESSSDFDPWGDLYQVLEGFFGDLFNH